MVGVVRFLLLILPGVLGARLLVSLAGKRFVYRMKEEEAEWLGRVEKIFYGKGKVAWKTGHGPLVVLVHGYGGCAAQWYSLADELVAAGYSVVAPDITSHGSSEGTQIKFRDFIDDIAELQEFLKEDVYAYVGHSAGAMCMMAARRIHGVTAKKYVCLASPSYPYPPLNAVKRKLSPPEKAVPGYKSFLARQFDANWADLPRRIYDFAVGSNLLLVFDSNDRYLNGGDLEAIKSFWPDAQELVTHDSGHEEILRSEECIGKVREFLQ